MYRRPWLACLLLALMGAMLLAQVPAPKYPREPPPQPLPFSHKTHAAARLTCNQCHPMPEPGTFARLPATQVCMGCHVSVKKDSPHIATLAAHHKENRKIAWAPVYRIPDWVSFSHKRHVTVSGVTCETCHGPVAERDALRREKDISMAACMECHRVKGASNECILCHDQR